MRVASLIPSATEALCRIGGEGMLVGRSHECDFPASVSGLPALTSQRTEFTTSGEVDRAVSASLAAGQSLYHLDADRLRSLRPDVILTQAMCRVCSIDADSVRAAVSGLDPEPRIVWLNPGSFEDVLDNLMDIGRAVGLEDESRRAVVELRNRFFAAADHVNPYAERTRVLFLEWTDPPFVGGHWTVQLVERAGGEHVLNATTAMANAGAGAGGQWAHRVAGASVRVTPEAIVAAAPEAVVVCPCGLDLAAARRETGELMRQSWFSGLAAVEAGRVAVVDGSQMFNRPGPRLVDAYEWLVWWLGGGSCDALGARAEGFPWSAWTG